MDLQGLYKGIHLFKYKTFLLEHRLQIITEVFKISVDLARKLITQTNDLPQSRKTIRLKQIRITFRILILLPAIITQVPT
jgi:hypothetical protein